MDTIFAQLKFGNKTLIAHLQRIMPLAGSAIATPNEAHDLDFFVLKNDELALFEAIQAVLPFATHVMQHDTSYPEQWTILTFRLLDETMHIQIILTTYQSPLDLVDDFDMDYVQAYLFQDKVHVTHVAQRALKCKRVFAIGNHDRSIRFEKAIFKEMQVAVFFDRISKKQKDARMVEAKDWDMTKIKLAPLGARNVQPIVIETLQVTNFEATNLAHKLYYNFILSNDKLQKRSAKFVALRCSVKTVGDAQPSGYQLLEIDGFPHAEWLRIRCLCNKAVEIKTSKPCILTFELSAKRDCSRYYLDVVQIWDDTTYVLNIPINPNFWTLMEISGCKDTRQLSSEALGILTQMYATEFAHRESPNEQTQQLNHICSEVFAALAYYCKENKPNVFAFCASQFLYDLEKQFNDKTAKNLLYTQEYKHLESIGGLRKFMDSHYSRMYFQINKTLF